MHKKIIGFLQKDNIVLTAHVGDLSKSKTEHSDAAFYSQDSAWLKAPARYGSQESVRTSIIQ